MRRSIITDDISKCFNCKCTQNLERHHCIHGSCRKLADKYGLTVMLCINCHKGTKGVHGKEGAELDLKLKRIAQEAWEAKYGDRQDWYRIFGKSYL